MTNAKTQLDNAVYGLNDAKMQIMQMVGLQTPPPSALLWPFTDLPARERRRWS